MAPDVFASGPCADVKLDISALGTAYGYALANTPSVPAALYPVSAYVTIVQLSPLNFCYTL